jgi:hypothetical protein
MKEVDKEGLKREWKEKEDKNKKEKKFSDWLESEENKERKNKTYRIMKIPNYVIWRNVVSWKYTDFSEVSTASIVRAMSFHRHDDGGNAHLLNVGLRQWDYTAPHHRRLSYSYSPPWEIEISQIGLYRIVLE